MSGSAADCRSVCVECGTSCTTLVHDGQGLVRIARCEHCGSVSDKYVEHDTLFLMIDLLLHRATAYRHLLCNHTLVQQASPLALLHVGAVVAICDVHLKHVTRIALLGSLASPSPAPSTSLPLGLAWPLLSSAVEFATFTVIATAVSGVTVGWRRVAIALLYSSVGKSLLALSMIWDYPAIFGAAIEAFTLSCNTVALRVVHEPRTLTATRATIAVVAAAAVRAAVAAVASGGVRPP